MLGVAWVGGTCDRNLNVAIVQDKGFFGGVLTAVHELGHSYVYQFNHASNLCSLFIWKMLFWTEFC